MSELREPMWGSTGRQVFERTYARKKANGAPEEWLDTVTRVVHGNLGLVDTKYHEPGERAALIDLFYNFKALPAGRHLWMSGVPGRQFLFNCHHAGWDAEDITAHFTFTFDQLMQGGGVGANYSNYNLDVYNEIQTPLQLHVVCSQEHPDYAELVSHQLLSDKYSADWTGAVVVDDSREGWYQALKDLINGFYDGNGEPFDLVFDLSNIRHSGSRIKTFGGTAAGPAPLALLLTNVANLLMKKVGEKLRSLDAMSIDHYIADCVVSGNVRRSARMAIKNWSEPDIFDFIHCKEDHQSHWTTNISVEIDKSFFQQLAAGDPHAKRVFRETTAAMLANGEPGFYNRSLAQQGEVGNVESTNPCVTGDTWVMTTDGPQRVEDLVGRSFEAVIDGKRYDAGRGFWVTGVKPVLTLSTTDGQELTLTANHQVMTDDGWVEAGNLKPGDKIRLHDHQGTSWIGRGTHAQGYALGHLVGDGTFGHDQALLCTWHADSGTERIKNYLFDTLDQMGHRSDWHGWRTNSEHDRMTSAALTQLAASYGIVRGAKTLNDAIEKTSSDFYRGFLAALFDTDGHVEGESTGGGVSVRLSNSDYGLLQGVQRMLARLGIRSVIRNLKPAGSDCLGYTTPRASYRLVITGAQAKRFMDTIGLLNQAKVAKWDVATKAMTRGFYDKASLTTVATLVPVGEEIVYDVSVADINAFDANGIYVHNCGEIALEQWENCNLGHVNLDAFVGRDDAAREAHRLMTRYLIRATFGDVPNARQREVLDRNRRIGVGHFGFQGWVVKQGVRYSDSYRNNDVRRKLRSFYDTVRKEAHDYSFQLRIPEPIKVTTVAPTGTIAKMPGKSEGIHPIYAKYFIRRVRYSTVDADQVNAVSELVTEGHHAEPDLYSRNTTVVEFLTKDSLMQEVEDLGLNADFLVESADEISLNDMLGVQAMYQAEYVDNAVSFTVNVELDAQQKAYMDHQVKNGVSPFELTAGPALESTVDATVDMLERWIPYLKGTTVMPDGSRPQAPYQRISKAEFDLAEYAASVASSVDEECANGACPVR